jgi:hypothetical protein
VQLVHLRRQQQQWHHHVGFLPLPFHILCASFSLKTVTKFWCQR